MERKQETPGENPTTASSGWRDATQFNQGERFEAGAAARPRRRPLLPVVLSGAAMLVVTYVVGLLGAPGWAALIVGVAVFAAGLVLTRPAPRVETAAARIEDGDAFDAKLKAAGLERRDVEAALDAAEAELAAIDETAATLHNAAFRPRLRRMTEAAREILRIIAQDPGDLRRARRFLKVYLPSARASVEKFAALGVINDPAIDAKFDGMVDDMIAAAERRRDALSLDDQIDLETEIDVLTERLAQEA